MSTTTYDVVVVGGGTAGVAAAVAAARAGARTCLVERQGLLGGMGTAAMVGTICGLYVGGAVDPPRALNEGVAAEVAAGLVASGSAPLRRGRATVLPYVPADLARVLDRLVDQAGVATLALHATCAAVERTGARVTAVRLVDWQGAREARCGAVVDASGDAMVAVLAGAATEVTAATERQLSSIVCGIQHVAPDAVGGPRSVTVLRRLREAEIQGHLEPGSAQASFLETGRPGEVLMKLALDEVTPVSTADEMTRAAMVGRRRVAAVAAYLAREVAGFREAFVSHVAPHLGVRETRRIVGRARLERADVLGARKTADGVARAAWPIERWLPGERGATYEWGPDGDWYDIPRGCLEHGEIENVLAAGRCMSASHEAIASARVMGTCLAVGEAAGRLAVERVRA